LCRLAVRCKRTPTQGIGEHSIEVLGDPRQWSRELFLAEESIQQFNRRIAGFDGHYLDSTRQSSPHSTALGLGGAWQTASMR
jgi:hypothetical protein